MQEINNDPNFVFIIDGGLGDHICSTLMVKNTKKYFPEKKLIIGAFYPEIFINNPHIDHLYNIRSINDMYEKWVKPLKYFNSCIKRDMYDLMGNKLWKGKMSQIWCYNYNIPYEKEDDSIEIFLTKDEIEYGKKIRNSFDNKPLILIQPFGAGVNYENNKITNNKDWIINYWYELTKILSKKYNLVQVGKNGENDLLNCHNLQGKFTPRETISLLYESETFISIDSFLGHASSTINKKGIVLFGRSNPHIVGHDNNINVWVENSCKENDLFCCRPSGNFCDYIIKNGKPALWECPHRSCMFELKPEIVLEKLKEININV